MATATLTRTPISRHYYGTPGTDTFQPVADTANVNAPLVLFRENYFDGDVWGSAIMFIGTIIDTRAILDSGFPEAGDLTFADSSVIDMLDLLEGRDGNDFNLTPEQLNEQLGYAYKVADRLADQARIDGLNY